MTPLGDLGGRGGCVLDDVSSRLAGRRDDSQKHMMFACYATLLLHIYYSYGPGCFLCFRRVFFHRCVVVCFAISFFLGLLRSFGVWDLG